MNVLKDFIENGSELLDIEEFKTLSAYAIMAIEKATYIREEDTKRMIRDILDRNFYFKNTSAPLHFTVVYDNGTQFLVSKSKLRKYVEGESSKKYKSIW